MENGKCFSFDVRLFQDEGAHSLIRTLHTAVPVLPQAGHILSIDGRFFKVLYVYMLGTGVIVDSWHVIVTETSHARVRSVFGLVNGREGIG